MKVSSSGSQDRVSANPPPASQSRRPSADADRSDTSVSSGSTSSVFSEATVKEINKARLGKTQVMEKIKRFNLTNSVVLSSLSRPLNDINPADNKTFSENLDTIKKHLASAVSNTRIEADWQSNIVQEVDVESGEDVGGNRRALEDLEAGADKLTKSLGDLKKKHSNFLGFDARKKLGTTSGAEKMQRHVFGKELHAVIARSAIQSGAIVAIAASMQVATVALLQMFYQNNPDKIPEGVLEAAKQELGGTATDKEAIELAIDSLASPGSTYLDADKNSDGAIYGAEAGVGTFNGIIIPSVDSQNEAAARAAQVRSSVLDPTPEPRTKGQKFRTGMASVWSSQLKASLASGAVASLVSTGATTSTTGPRVLLEMAKTVGFASLGGVSNSIAFGGKDALTGEGDSEAKAQGIKAGLRVGGRVVYDVLKTSTSYLQSTLEGNLSTRSLAGDAIKGAMTALVTGSIKEGIGAGAQKVTASHLPPNEVAMLAVGDAVADVAKFAQLLSRSDVRELLSPVADNVQALNDQMDAALGDVISAIDLDFHTDAFDEHHDLYQQELKQAVAGEREKMPADTFGESDDEVEAVPSGGGADHVSIDIPPTPTEEKVDTPAGEAKVPTRDEIEAATANWNEAFDDTKTDGSERSV